MAFPLNTFVAVRRPFYCARDYTLAYEVAIQTVLRSDYNEVVAYCLDKSQHILPRRYLSAALSDILLNDDDEVFLNEDEKRGHCSKASKFNKALQKARGDDDTVDIVYVSTLRRLLRRSSGEQFDIINMVNRLTLGGPVDMLSSVLNNLSLNDAAPPAVIDIDDSSDEEGAMEE